MYCGDDRIAGNGNWFDLARCAEEYSNICQYLSVEHRGHGDNDNVVLYCNRQDGKFKGSTLGYESKHRRINRERIQVYH